MYSFKRKVNYYETDKMGIVHHSNYIRFFEEARCSLLEEARLPYDVMEDKGILSPVLGVSCKYKQHITFGDTIEIRTHIKDFSGVKFTIAYEVYNSKTNTLCVTGESNHCFTDSSLKPLNIKKHHYDVFEKFMNLVEKGTGSFFA